MRTSAGKGVAILNASVWALVMVNVLAVLGVFVYAWVTAGWLPARYPVHFGANGVADRWSTAGSLEWFLLPVIAAVMAVGLVALALWLPRLAPERWNLGRAKSQFIGMTEAQRAPIIRATVVLVLALALLGTLLIAGIQWSMFRSALAGRMVGLWPVMVIAGVAYTVLLAWGIARPFQLIKRTSTKGPRNLL